MMATPSKLDPDAFIRERVFQRIVNVTGIDPKTSAQGALRLHIIISTTCMLALLAWCLPLVLAKGQSIFIPVMMAVMMLGNISMPFEALRHSPAWSLRTTAAAHRILMIGVVALLWAMSFMTMGLKIRVMVRMSIIGLGLGWPMGVGAIYLHLCLPAPPRTPRTSTSRVRQTA